MCYNFVSVVYKMNYSNINFEFLRNVILLFFRVYLYFMNYNWIVNNLKFYFESGIFFEKIRYINMIVNVFKDIERDDIGVKSSWEVVSLVEV